MSQQNSPVLPEPGGTETTSERASRIASEAALITQARAEIKAGLGIDDDAMETWFDQLDANPDAPPPRPSSTPGPHR